MPKEGMKEADPDDIIEALRSVTNDEEYRVIESCYNEPSRKDNNQRQVSEARIHHIAERNKDKKHKFQIYQKRVMK